LDKLYNRAAELGYIYAINNYRASSGACVSDFLYLLEDNPDLVKVINQWIDENLDNLSDDDEDDEEISSLDRRSNFSNLSPGVGDRKTDI
jgi:hypothetical protein